MRVFNPECARMCRTEALTGAIPGVWTVVDQCGVAPPAVVPAHVTVDVPNGDSGFSELTPEESDDSQTPFHLRLISHFLASFNPGFCSLFTPPSSECLPSEARKPHGNRGQEPGWVTFLTKR